jgi:hypothetical protein
MRMDSHDGIFTGEKLRDAGSKNKLQLMKLKTSVVKCKLN